MGRIKLALVCIVIFVCVGVLRAGTYTLTDGSTVSGDPVSYDKSGVVLKSGGSFLPRTPWEKLSQDSLKLLMTEAKRPQDASFIEPFLEEITEEVKKAKKEIAIKQPPKMERPTQGIGIFAAFKSSIGLVIILVLYLANIYAGFEIAYYRRHPFGLVCGVSAVAPVIGPIVFLCMPPRLKAPVEQVPTAEGELRLAEREGQPVSGEPEVVGTVETITEVASKTGRVISDLGRKTAEFIREETHGDTVPQAAPAPVELPPAVTFKRGEFTFNRRFFETKMPGFFRVVPNEADKDMVLYIKSGRGEFIGKRISKITQTELYLLTFKEEVTAEEMIPFAEIYETQIRHKDMA